LKFVVDQQVEDIEMPENLKLNTFLKEFHSDCPHPECSFGLYGFAFGQSPFPVPKIVQEAVGYTENVLEIKSTVQKLIDKEIIPEAQASSILKHTQQVNNNSEIVQISLAVAGLGILFGAVYGIKRKVDDNSKLISINREIIRKKIIQPIFGLNPKDILKIRLAKGEITLEEYEKIKLKLY
jgi:hypothetical protein